MNSIFKSFLLLSAFAFVLSSCVQDEEVKCYEPTDPECENYDPCYGRVPTSSYFSMAGQAADYGQWTDLFVEDHVFLKDQIRFRAFENNATFKWYIDGEQIENDDDEIFRNASDLSPGVYTTALVVEKEPDTFCFPMDDGIDSTQRTFKIVERCQLEITSKFEGFFHSTPQQTDTIEFIWMDIENWEEDCAATNLCGINLSGNNDTIYTAANAYVNRRIWWTSSDTNNQPDGTFRIDQAGNCTAEYTYLQEERKFTGRLID